MNKIKNNITNSINIDKSTFITNLFLVNSVEETNELLVNVRKKYYDATHNCYAYILDNGLIQKCSDDKEPSKTAGYPMLDVLKKQNLTNILAVTTRYYGGVKLGAGGLVRAYSKSVSDALLCASFTTTKEFNKYEISFDYSFYNFIQVLENITITDSIFSENIALTLLIEPSFTDDVLENIKNLTKSKVNINFISAVMLDV
ncbi:MAG: YigZ family protein [bacterium]